MKAVLFRDLVQEQWASIEVYADRLINGLQRLDAPDWSFVSAWKELMTGVASPACLRIASLKVRDSPSCISLVRVRTPHSAGVRNLRRVV